LRARKKGRVVRDSVFQAQITKPAIGEVDLNLSANLTEPQTEESSFSLADEKVLAQLRVRLSGNKQESDD
jgi:hypothetical protein